MSIRFLQGKGFYFRELQQNDLNGNWYSWFNDQQVTEFQNKKIFPNSYEKQKEYYDYLIDSKMDVVFAIVDESSNLHIGNVGLHKIDWVHRSAELGIVIGEKEFHGRKIGSQAWSMITHYGFKTLNLHRIYALVMEGNITSRKCAEGSGFKLEGTISDYFYKNGEYQNVCYYNITTKDGI
tara:strand:- start:23512 stop:24051 length:540 start_codon:yes stop_codon:yes gene_type:complete